MNNPYQFKEGLLTQDQVIVRWESFPTKIFRWLGTRNVSLTLMIILAVMALVFTSLFLLISVSAFVIYMMRGGFNTLPVHLPITEDKVKYDFNNPKIGGEGFNEPEGVVYLGFLDRIGSTLHQQIFIKLESLLRHIIVFGTTGAGKTEFLLSLTSNFLALSGAVFFNDAKGTMQLGVACSALARYFGRDMDFRLLNYNKGAAPGDPDPARRLTNTSAPFSQGSSDSGVQLMNGLMPGEKGGNNAIFQEAAASLISVLYPTLRYLRDINYLRLDPSVIRKYSAYDDFCSLITNPHVPRNFADAMWAFVKSRSGYNASKSFNKQAEEVRKQFGFAQAYFTRQLSLLSDSYGEIYLCGTGELDYADVLLQNRFAVSLFPPLEKSTEEMGSLGKLSLTAQKNTLALGLGNEFEGSTEDVLDSLPMASEIPSLILTDEIAYIIVSGFAVTNAQARGLKVIICSAGQDYAGIKNANANEAEQMIANARLKIILSSEADESTYKLITSLFSQYYAYIRTGSDSDSSSYMGARLENTNYSLTSVAAITPEDLRRLNEGEGVLIFQDKYYFFRTFFHGITRSKFPQMSRLVKLGFCEYRPSRGLYKNLMKFENIRYLDDCRVLLRNIERPEDVGLPSDSNRAISKAYKIFKESGLNSEEYSTIELGLAMLNCFEYDQVFVPRDEEKPSEPEPNNLDTKPNEEPTILGGLGIIGDFGSDGDGTGGGEHDKAKAAASILEAVMKENANPETNTSSLAHLAQSADDEVSETPVGSRSKVDPAIIDQILNSNTGKKGITTAGASATINSDVAVPGTPPLEDITLGIENPTAEEEAEIILKNVDSAYIKDTVTAMEMSLGSTQEQAESRANAFTHRIIETNRYPKNKPDIAVFQQAIQTFNDRINNQKAK